MSAAEALSIAETSIMLIVVSGNTKAVAIMIGKRAADTAR
jgi:hypothetical protein